MRSVVGSILILIITFCSVFIVKKMSAGVQVDLTQDRLYSLHEGTKNIIGKLSEKVAFKLFYAKTAVDRTGEDQLVRFNNYYGYVRDLLNNYVRQSKGALTLEEYDPRPFSDAEELADELRLQRFPISESEGFYFGVAIKTESGGQEVIPFLGTESQERVEYRISELLDRATRRNKTKVGVMSSLDVTGGGMSADMRRMMQMQGRQVQQPWLLFGELEKTYELVEVEAAADEVPVDVDYLVVVHPKDFEEKALYAIDQFVMRGGKLVVFQDPFAYIDQPAPNPQNPYAGASHPRNSDLNQLLSKYGVEMKSDEFAGDMALANPVPADPQRRTTVMFPGFVSMTKTKGLSQDAVITEGLDRVEAFIPGVLRKTDSAEGKDFVPLVTTTASGNTWTASGFELGGPTGPNFAQIAAKFEKGVEELVIAARLTGDFESAFDGKPGAGEAVDGDEKASDEEATTDGSSDEEEATTSAPTDDGAPHLAKTSESNSILVFADVDMFADFLAFQRIFGQFVQAKNSAYPMLLNGLETLAGSRDLLSIRARGGFQRPFEVVDAIEREAEVDRQDKVEAINADIKAFQEQLRSLQTQATEENVGVLENEAITKRRNLEREIRAKQRELNDVQAASREEIEDLEGWIQFTNIWLVPGLVLIAGILVAVLRTQSRRRYVTGGVA